ncbi:hypothetical protein [Geomicrobium sp. JCM 19039]|uniref:hypothetical protein n=1 Tax=Geomicrobium sp. JCM 19039 TaxID=1460636 RepID=UPI0005A824A1|nr:hypothetical protein [Geomicrobium sp. JCM 19039]
MDIHITDYYKITTVPLNYVVYERREKRKDGKPTGDFAWTNISYCGSFEKAVKKIIEKEQHRMDVSNLEELLQAFDTKKNEVIDAVRSLPSTPELPEKRAKEAE